MHNALDLVREKGLDGKNRESILKSWTASQIIDFTTEFEIRIRDQAREEREESANGVFDFAAPLDLSGGRYPCSELNCRISHIDRMAQFAVLYADSVRMISPLTLPEIGESFELGKLRYEVFADLCVLDSVIPLIEDGLIKVKPASLALCPKHLLDTRKFRDRLDRATKAAVRPFLPKINITQVEVGENLHYVLTGPEELFEHGASVLVVPPNADRPTVRAKMKLLKRVLEWRLNSMVIQDVMGGDANYLITTDIEAEIYSLLNPESIADRSANLAEGMRHAFPFVENLDIQTLMEIRKENDDSFVVYRDAIRHCLSSTDVSSVPALKKTFSESVIPEINKINLVINNSKERLRRSIAQDIFITSVVVTIGLATGVLPVGAAAVFAGIGGADFLRNTVKIFDEFSNGPSDSQNSNYYFLWKIKQAANN